MARKRRLWRRPAPAILAVAAAAALGYAVVAPVAACWWEGRGAGPGDWPLGPLRMADQICTRSLELLAGLWLFALGATIGSFLNVVAYRMPRGRTIIWSTSHCPRCGAAIAPRDNIPVLSWLLLQGRCRTCRLPISARYPLVELGCGLMFLGLAVAEWTAAGVVGPGQVVGPGRGLARALFGGRWELVRDFAFHSCLLSVLLSWSLIRWDHFGIPRRSVVAALLIGAAAPALWPDLRPLADPTGAAGSGGTSSGWAASQAQGAVALAGGVVLGAVMGALAYGFGSPGRAAGRSAGRGAAITLALGLVGLYTGWRSVVSIAAMASVTYGCARLAARHRPFWGRPPLLSHLFAASFIHICFWRLLFQLPWWPGATDSVVSVGAACAAIACLGLDRVLPAHQAGSSSGATRIE